MTPLVVHWSHMHVEMSFDEDFRVTWRNLWWVGFALAACAEQPTPVRDPLENEEVSGTSEKDGLPARSEMRSDADAADAGGTLAGVPDVILHPPDADMHFDISDAPDTDAELSIDEGESDLCVGSHRNPSECASLIGEDCDIQREACCDSAGGVLAFCAGTPGFGFAWRAVADGVDCICRRGPCHDSASCSSP